MHVHLSVLFCVSYIICVTVKLQVLSLFHSAPFWPMICPDGERFASFIVDWMELPTFKEAYISCNCNSVFGNENLNFRMIASRVHFDC